MKYSKKWPIYKAQWDSMTINPKRAGEFKRLAEFAFKHDRVYRVIEEQSGVPWPLVACLHRRESNADFDTYLGNGEPLDRVTRLVPKGRGPFPSFEEGALDALELDGLSKVKDWRLEKILYFWEIFNGTGYDIRGLPSPYLWAGTNIQRVGKYTSDGHWSPQAIDPQPGCCGLLKAIMAHDSSINFQRED